MKKRLVLGLGLLLISVLLTGCKNTEPALLDEEAPLVGIGENAGASEYVVENFADEVSLEIIDGEVEIAEPLNGELLTVEETPVERVENSDYSIL